MTLLVARSMYPGGASRTRTRSTRCRVAERARRLVRAVYATRNRRTTGIPLPLDQSCHESFPASPGVPVCSSRLFLFSNIQTSRPATVSGSHCMHRAPTVRDGMFHNCYVCRSATQARYRQISGQSHGPFDDVVRGISNACRASVAHRIARICRSALRFLAPPLLSVQPTARAIVWPWSCSTDQFDTQSHSRRTNRQGGKCCECVTRIRNGVVASASGPCNARALMECTGIPVDAHATNDSMRIGARRRTAKAAQVRQTIRSTHDTYLLRRRSRAGIRPGGTLILR